MLWVQWVQRVAARHTSRFVRNPNLPGQIRGSDSDQPAQPTQPTLVDIEIPAGSCCIGAIDHEFAFTGNRAFLGRQPLAERFWVDFSVCAEALGGDSEERFAQWFIGAGCLDYFFREAGPVASDPDSGFPCFEYGELLDFPRIIRAELLLGFHGIGAIEPDEGIAYDTAPILKARQGWLFNREASGDIGERDRQRGSDILSAVLLDGGQRVPFELPVFRIFEISVEAASDCAANHVLGDAGIVAVGEHRDSGMRWC